MTRGFYTRTPEQKAQAAQAGRISAEKRRNATHCHVGHKLTEDNVYIVKQKDGSTRRNCIQCRRATSKRYRLNHPGYHTNSARNRLRKAKRRTKIIDDPIMAKVNRSRLLEHARATATGELARLAAEQKKDESQLIWSDQSTVSLDAPMFTSEGTGSLYDIIAISDYQEELEDRLTRLVGY